MKMAQPETVKTVNKSGFCTTRRLIQKKFSKFVAESSGKILDFI